MEIELDRLKKEQIELDRGRLCLRGCGIFYEYRDIYADGRRTSSSRRLFDEKEIFTIQRQKIIRARIKAITVDLKLIGKIEKRFRAYDEKTVRSMLPAAYRARTQYEVDLERADIDAWKNAPYKRLDKPFPESINKTAGGRRTRSLSEANIGTALELHGIPYRYEQALILKDENGYKVTRYPDFTILCRNGKTLYWEHAGMISAGEYRKAHAEKLALYDSNGIIAGYNLIITGGGKKGAMDLEGLYDLIDNFVAPKVFG